MALCRLICLAITSIALLLLLISSIVLLIVQWKHPTPPRYYAAIDTVPGIDDGLGSRRWQPDKELVLSVGVQSQSPLWGRMCLERGTTVTVAYHGVSLARGTLGREVCAPRWLLWKVRWTTVVARGSKVDGTLPAFVVNGLAADARRGGVQVFDVTLRIPATGHVHGDGGKLVSCLARHVGDGSPAACNVHYE